jgi:hypothetical protein
MANPCKSIPYDPADPDHETFNDLTKVSNYLAIRDGSVLLEICPFILKTTTFFRGCKIFVHGCTKDAPCE